MKIVINKCYGGFGLSARAVARIAEIEGRPCYFFQRDRRKGLNAPEIPTTIEKIEADGSRIGLWNAYDIPDPHSTLPSQGNWHEMTMEQRQFSNQEWALHTHEGRYSHNKRNYAPLVQAAEELGEKANGGFADLHVVEIPDGVEYEIDEYDGVESIHEVHRSWG
jgi:hypothetical protein